MDPHARGGLQGRPRRGLAAAGGHDRPAVPGQHRLPGRPAGAGPPVLRRPVVPGGGLARGVPGPGPVLVLRLLRREPGRDVLPHRRVGPRGLAALGAEVLPLHPGRVAGHAPGHPRAVPVLGAAHLRHGRAHPPAAPRRRRPAGGAGLPRLRRRPGGQDAPRARPHLAAPGPRGRPRTGFCHLGRGPAQDGDLRLRPHPVVDDAPDLRALRPAAGHRGHRQHRLRRAGVPGPDQPQAPGGLLQRQPHGLRHPRDLRRGGGRRRRRRPGSLAGAQRSHPGDGGPRPHHRRPVPPGRFGVVAGRDLRARRAGGWPGGRRP